MAGKKYNTAVLMKKAAKESAGMPLLICLSFILVLSCDWQDLLDAVRASLAAQWSLLRVSQAMKGGC